MQVPGKINAVGWVTPALLWRGQMVGRVEVGKIVPRRATENGKPFGYFDGLLVFAFAFFGGMRLKDRAAQRYSVMGLYRPNLPAGEHPIGDEREVEIALFYNLDFIVHQVTPDEGFGRQGGVPVIGFRCGRVTRNFLESHAEGEKHLFFCGR